MDRSGVSSAIESALALSLGAQSALSVANNRVCRLTVASASIPRSSDSAANRKRLFRFGKRSEYSLARRLFALGCLALAERPNRTTLSGRLPECCFGFLSSLLGRLGLWWR